MKALIITIEAYSVFELLDPESDREEIESLLRAPLWVRRPDEIELTTAEVEQIRSATAAYQEAQDLIAQRLKEGDVL